MYCDNRWHEYVYNPDQVKDLKCNVCGDRNLKVDHTDDKALDIFGYDVKDVNDAYIKKDKKK